MKLNIKIFYHMRNLLLTIAAMLVAGMVMSAAERKFEVMSPDATLKAEVVLGESVSYSVWKNNQKILDPSFVSMELSDGTFFGKGASLKKASRSKADNVLSAPFYKKSQVVEKYNELTLTFKTHKIIFRVYDAGVAYRFESLKKGDYQVVNEKAEFAFPSDNKAWIPYVKRNKKGSSPFMNSFENLYTCSELSGWDKEGFAFLPLMVEGPDGYKVNIMESDLLDYPGMYLRNTDGDTVLESLFAPYPKIVEQGGHNML